MRPIVDIGDLEQGRVLYHSAFGFARIAELNEADAQLRWEHADANLPERVTVDALRRVYALCPADGFFHLSVVDREALQERIHFDPSGALASLLSDLPGPQTPADVRDWMVRRDLMTAAAFEHWWKALAPTLTSDPRFRADGERFTLAESADVANGEALLQDVTLTARKRLDLAIAHRDTLPVDLFHEHILLAWRSGGPSVRDLAMNALRGAPPDAILRGLLGPGPDSLESIVHAIRRGGWSCDQLTPGTINILLERLERGAMRGGPLDAEGRLAAALVRWGVEETHSVLARVSGNQDGQRLVRSTMEALPPRRGVALTMDVLRSAIQDGSPPQATHWLAGEILEQRGLGADELADELGEEDADLARWFRSQYDPFFDDDWDNGNEVGTTEIDADWLTQAVSTTSRPVRSGATMLSVGEHMAKALVALQRAGEPCHPSRELVAIRVDGTVEFSIPGHSDGGILPPGEQPSLAGDVYAAAILLVESLLGVRWPNHINGTYALPYLRHVAPALPPAAIAPLDAALHHDPALRPANGAAWHELWRLAAAAEEARLAPVLDEGACVGFGYDSHIGKVKLLKSQTNQDAVFVASRAEQALLVVCDGISTATAGSGDIASGIATHVIAGLWEQALPRLREDGPAQATEFLNRALRMANQAICEATLRGEGGRLEGKIPMGTTVIAAVTHGSRISLAWLGDSRAYLIGPYGASLLTADQNQAGERFTAWVHGGLSGWDPNGYALVGYLGHFDQIGRPEALPAQHASVVLLPGERVVLCSDGVTDYLAEQPDDVARRVAAAVIGQSLEHAARSLVWAANDGGGGDNISAVVAGLTLT